MKIRLSLVLMFCVCLLPNCSNINKRKLELAGRMTKDASSLGKGVWTQIPENFRKAISFDGYQHDLSMTTMSVEIIDPKIEYYQQQFSKKALRARKRKLMEKRRIVYAQEDIGFMTIDKHFSKSIINYNVFIPHNGKLYRFKAFCHQRNIRAFGKAIRKAIQNLYFDEIPQEKPPFQLAGLGEDGDMLFTRDAKFPTEDNSKAILKASTLADVINFSDIENAMNAAMAQMTDSEEIRVENESFRGIKYYYMLEEDEQNLYYVVLIKLPDELEASLFSASALKTEKWEDFRAFILKGFIHAEIR